MNTESTALKELKRVFDQHDLVNKSDQYLDDCEIKVSSLFPQLSNNDLRSLRDWLYEGNTVSNKINNYLTIGNWLSGPDGCSLGSIFTDSECDSYGEMFSWVVESITECYEHVDSTDSDWLVFVWGFIQKDSVKHSLTLRVMARDPRPEIGILVWDERVFYPDDVLACAYTASLIEEEILFQDGLPIDKQRLLHRGPLFKYHPARYKQSREYVRAAPGILKSEGLRPGVLNVESINIVSQIAAMEANRERSNISLRVRKDDKYNPIKVITNEMDCYVMYNDFVSCGKKIFDLNPPLVEMFRDTSVDAIPVSFITSPFQNYYLFFGKQEHLCTGNGWYIDGVYVQHYPQFKLITFLFTSCAEKESDTARWYENSEPFLKCTIADDLFDLNLGAAIDKVIETKRAEMLKRIEEGDIDRTSEFQNYVKENGGEVSDYNAGKIIDIGATSAKARLEELDTTVGTLKAALSLAVNSVCYLTAYPDDIDLDWASETPRALVERATKGHPNVKKNTESKLVSSGYQKVYLCGRKLTQGPVSESTESQGSKRTHWRRFHWRLQPYGPKRSLRKAIIIEATLINPGAGYEEEPTGTIYIDKNVVDLKSVKKQLGFASKRYWEGME